jgi:hypothetical protein
LLSRAQIPQIAEYCKHNYKGTGAYRCAGLDKEFADRCPVIHGVKGSNFVYTGRGHLEDSCYFIHDADAGKAMLTLAKIEDRHNSRLLVLGWVSLEDLGNYLLVLGGKFKGKIGVVIGRVSVLLGRLLAL